MKKKIFTILLTLLLSIPLICKHISVKASENAWTSTGIKAIDCNNKTIEDVVSDGCLISIVDFLDTIQNYIYFINLHEQKNYEVINKDIVDVINFINCLNEFKGKYSYFEDSSNYGSYFIYFHSKSKLNNWLVNNRYIDPLQTFEDPIYGFTGPEQNKIERNPYICLDALLKSDLNYQIIDPRTLPKEFYKENEKTIGNKWYTIYNSYDFSIINGIWNYQIPAITEEEGEKSKKEILDSVGKFEKISNSSYQYIYTTLSWNKEFGYYSHNQAEVKSLTLQENEMPSIAFDSNGYLKDDYYSVNNNTWYKAYVKDVTKEIEIEHYVKSVYPFLQDLTKYDVPTKRHSWKYFEVYFNFDFNNGFIDCLYELSYNLNLYYLPFSGFIDSVSYFVDNFSCNLKFNQKIISSDVPENWLNALIWNIDSSEKNVIEKGNYFLSDDNKKNYEFEYKTIFIDDKYSAYDANPGGINKNKYVCLLNWNNNAKNHPTYFNELYYCVKNSDMQVSAVFSYQNVLYSFENVDSNLVNPKDEEDDMFSKILKWLKELFSKLINWFKNSTFGKVLKWILIVVFSLLTIYIIYAIKKSKSLKNKKSTK